MDLSIPNLLLVLFVAWTAGRLASRLGYPAVLGELTAGILLGPPLLGLLHADAALQVLADLGVLLMMTYIGMEIDPRELRRASKAGFLAAVGGFITPFVLCYLVVMAFGGPVMSAVFVGIAAGVTSLAVKSRILVDLQLLDTRIAHVLMAGSLIADTASLIIFAAVLGAVQIGSVDPVGVALLGLKAVAFFAVAILVGKKVFPRLGRLLETRGVSGRTANFTLVLVLALALAEMAHLAGMHGILGAFIAGLFLREGVFGRALTEELTGLVRDASIGFLAPVFFVTAGFAVTFDVFSSDLLLLVLVIVLATVGKVVGTTLFYLPTGYGWREGLTVGAGMNGRGAVEIIVAQIALSMGLITQGIFSILVFMAIVTTAFDPVFLKWGVEWLRRRGELVRSGDERRGVLIVGGGAVSRAMGRILAGSQAVSMVDRNPENCDAATAAGLTAVRGNALDELVLSDAGAAAVRYAIVTTPNAEVNALATQILRSTFLVPEISVLSSGDPHGHAALIQHLRAVTLFGRPVNLLEWDYRVNHGQVEINPIEVVGEPREAGPFLDAASHPGALPVAVRRGGEFQPWSADLVLEPGDAILLLEHTLTGEERRDAFDRLVAGCPVLDLGEPLTSAEFFDRVAGVMGARLHVESGTLASMLCERERQGSTVFLPGLAIPHVVVPGEDVFDLVIARCSPGITFPGDAGSVQSVFVLAGSADQRTSHLRALSAIAQTVQGPDFERAWQDAPDSEALRRLVLGANRRRFSSTVRSPSGDGGGHQE
jgi:Kef-type K+ transport system membrane component KefB/mannitol/fructose-specific phosphotransferase system IIA component (Ntr-type)